MSIDAKESKDLKGCQCDASKDLKPPKGTQGWVECDDEDGFKVVPGPLKDIPNSDCCTKCGADGCTKEHEEHHIEQFKDFCPDACKSIPCGYDRTGWKMGVVDENNCKEKIECYGNKAWLECLKDLYNKHKDAERQIVGVRCLNQGPNGAALAPCWGYLKALYNSERTKVLKMYRCKSKEIGIDS